MVASLHRKDLAVTYAAIDMLNSLMHSMSGDYNLKQEQLNKSSLLSSKQFLENLLNTWTEHVNLGSGALVLSAMLDFLTFALCVPYSETTDSKQFDGLLEMVASRGRAMFKLFQVCNRTSRFQFIFDIFHYYYCFFLSFFYSASIACDCEGSWSCDASNYRRR